MFVSPITFNGEPPDESACSLGWTCSRTGARYWILLNWSTSTNTISCAFGRPNLAFVRWLCVVKDTSRTRFLIRQLCQLPHFLFCFVLGVQQINSRTFTSVEYIEKVICALQGRLVTLMDLPTVAPYFFVPPAWADAEARAMLDGISTEDYQIVMRGTAERLKSASPWDTQTLADALHAESKAGAIKPAKFMTALRHALSGTKVNPSFENDGLRI